jgi:hypothetical protein
MHAENGTAMKLPRPALAPSSIVATATGEVYSLDSVGLKRRIIPAEPSAQQ